MLMRIRLFSSICFLTLLFSSYLFNVKFVFLKFSIFYPAVIVIVMFGVFCSVRSKKLFGELVFVVFPLFVAVVFSIISFVVNYIDADYFFTGAIFFLAAVGFCSFGFFEFFSNIDGRPLIAGVVAAFTLNAILMIFMFMSAEFQNAYLNILDGNIYMGFGGRELALDSMYRLRMIGATGFATYASGFAQVIGLFFLSVYYYIDGKKPDLVFVFLSVLLVISALLASRSALLGVFLWFIFCLIYFRRRFLLAFSSAVVLVVFFLVSIRFVLDVDSADFFMNWILDFFINGVSAPSLDENIKMLDTTFLDSGIFGFSRWFGDSGYDYFRSVDVGYIRVFLAGGYSAFIFITLHFFLLGVMFFTRIDSYFWRTLYVFLILYFCVVMFKGAIIFDFFAFDFLLLMLYWVGRHSEKPLKLR